MRALLCLVAAFSLAASVACAREALGHPVAATPLVVPLQIIPAKRAADIVHRLFPSDKVTVEPNANAIIVVAAPSDADGIRQIVSAIDVKSPTAATVEALPLRVLRPSDVVARIHQLFPMTKAFEGPARSVILSATSQDLQQIKALVTAIDVPAQTPSPAPTYLPESVRVAQAPVRTIARAAARTAAHTRITVSGSSIILNGPADEVAQAKTLIAQLDSPPAGVRYTQVYRMRFVDAASVAELLRRSFHNIDVQVDKDLNALSVLATYSEHSRIASALAQLDVGPGALGVAQGTAGEPGGTGAGAGGYGGADVEVVNLKAAVPGLNGAPSTSASDMAQTISQTMQGVAPDLRVTVPANSTQLVLTGSQYSIELAKRLIAQLDIAQPLVVLDTEILEVDETVAKNLGLQFNSPLVTSTFTEVSPTQGDFGIPARLIGLQPLTRTPLAAGLTINMLVQNGQARILADPRITVISGRTASIRAGDTISILTTTGGGSGTVPTTQLQSFQTGVTLDITPVVNAQNYISVSLHPTVNSLEGLLNGVPQIATRDAQTTVGLQEDQTLIIGGLIQDNTNRSESRIPVLGDLPLVGRAFRNQTLNKSRNELIVTVTPHILKPGQAYVSAGPALPTAPTPQPLPTLPPDTRLPTPRPTIAPTVVAGTVPALARTPPPSAFTNSPTALSTKETPRPTSSPVGVPIPTPSAFANLNVFTYGHAPNGNYARDADPAKIFFVQFSPTVIANNTPVTLSAITTTNVRRVTITYGQAQTQIASTSPGVWQSTYNFNTAGRPDGDASITLTAYKTDGTFATLNIPITLAR